MTMLKISFHKLRLVNPVIILHVGYVDVYACLYALSISVILFSYMIALHSILITVLNIALFQNRTQSASTVDAKKKKGGTDTKSDLNVGASISPSKRRVSLVFS
jgi:hypothetical protein